jgi:hypothetical protein
MQNLAPAKAERNSKWHSGLLRQNASQHEGEHRCCMYLFSPDSSTGHSRTRAHKDLAKGPELAFLLSDFDEKSLDLIRVLQYEI